MSRLRFVGVSLVLMTIGIGFGVARERLFDRDPVQLETRVETRVEVVRDQSPGEFDWNAEMAAGQVLEIKGVNGPIRAVAADGPVARVEAEKQARRSDPDEVRIEVVEHRDGITICAVYPSRDGENSCEPGSGGRNSVRNNDVRVEFVVEVPAGVRFVARTVNGEVDARGLEGPADIQTVNGDVEVETTHGASARTVNGSITASLGAGWDENVTIETVNGSIEIDVPDQAGADVDAAWVNGSLEVDMPLALQGRMSRRSARGTLGSGGPDLELKTVNGSIRIY
jgi:hypothetical protein